MLERKCLNLYSNSANEKILPSITFSHSFARTNICTAKTRFNKNANLLHNTQRCLTKRFSRFPHCQWNLSIEFSIILTIGLWYVQHKVFVFDLIQFSTATIDIRWTASIKSPISPYLSKFINNNLPCTDIDYTGHLGQRNRRVCRTASCRCFETTWSNILSLFSNYSLILLDTDTHYSESQL